MGSESYVEELPVPSTTAAAASPAAQNAFPGHPHPGHLQASSYAILPQVREGQVSFYPGLYRIWGYFTLGRRRFGNILP